MRILTFLCVALLSAGCCVSKSVHGPRRATIDIDNGAGVKGTLVMEQASANSPVKIRGTIRGLEAGLHGMHVHEGTQLGTRCELVGGHFNPKGKFHGGPHDPERHVGDLGNIKVLEGGAGNPSRADVNILSMMSLSEESPNCVLGRALVIHANKDDLGRNKTLESQTGGSSGAIVVCALIQGTKIVEPATPERPQTADNHFERFKNHERVVRDADKPVNNVQHPFYGAAAVDEAVVESEVDLSLKEPISTDKIWKAGQTYEYDYKGFISTAMLSISPKYAGGSIKGRLVVQPVDDHTIHMQLVDVSAKMFNEDVMQDMMEADPGHETTIFDREALQKPIEMKMINGKIQTVTMAKDEPLWTVNFKRALAAQLQLQLNAQSALFAADRAQSAYYADNAVYHTKEGCTSGECQTWYQISRLPVEQIRSQPDLLPVPELCAGNVVYEVVKSRNFDRCDILPVFNYVSTRGMACSFTNGAGCQNELSHGDTVRVVGCKSSQNGQFIVQKVKSTDRLMVKPLSYETEALDGQTVQHLHLRSVSASKSQSESLKSKMDGDVQIYQTLTYAYDDEHKTHGPLMEKPSLREYNSPMVMDLKEQTLPQEAERLLKEILEDLESDAYYADPSSKLVADKIDMFRRVLSLFGYTDLVAFVSNYTSSGDDSTTKQILVDSLVMAGSNPSLMIVRDMILKGYLNGEMAAQAVSYLPATVKTPTKELLTSFIDLLKSEPVVNDSQLKMTLALSLTRLINQACINRDSALNLFPKLVMGRFCHSKDSFITAQLLPWLSQQLNDATETGEKIAMLAALGNLGHEMIIPSVMPYISSCEPSTTSEYDWMVSQRRPGEADEDEDQDQSRWAKKSSRDKWIDHKKKKKSHKHRHSSIREMLDKYRAKKQSGQKDWDSEDLPAVEEDRETTRLRLKAKYMGHKHKKTLTDDSNGEEETRGFKHHHRSHRSTKSHHKSHARHQHHGHHSKNRTEEMDVDTYKPWEIDSDMKVDNDMEMILEEDVSQPMVESKLEDDEVEYLWDPSEEEEILRQYEAERDQLREGRYAADMDEEAEDDATCNTIRSKAIFALSHLAAQKKSVVSTLLMPIYFNKEEQTQVRLSALTLLFVSNPPPAFWQRVALSTWFEPDDQLSHFIYTTITSLVANKDPKQRDSVNKAESVLPMMKPMRWISYVSANYMKAGYEEKSRLGYVTKTSHFPGFESFVPSNHYNSLHLHLGAWYTKLVEYSVNSKNADKFVDLLKGKAVDVSPLMKHIEDELKIEARATGTPQLFIYLNVVDNYQRFFTFNPSTIQRTLENLIRKSLFSPDATKMSINYHKYVPLFDTFIRIPSSMGVAYSLFGHARLFASLKSSVEGSVDFKPNPTVKLEGHVQPVFTFAAMQKLSVETPFSRSYPAAGIHLETSVALPGRFSIEGDVQSGKMMTSWQFSGDKIRLAKHSVVPFTTVRQADDFRPTLLMENTLPIILLEEPQQQEIPFGGSAVGLNLIQTVRGDIEAVKSPLAYSKDWFGTLVFYALPSTLKYRESSLYLDSVNSETQVIKTFWSFARKNEKSVQLDADADEDLFSKPLFSTIYADKIKSERFIESQDDDWTAAKLQSIFKSLNDATGYTVDFAAEFSGRSGAGESRRFGTSLAYGVGDRGLSHRAKLMMEKRFDQPEGQDNFVLCMELEANTPKPVMIRREDFAQDDLSRTSSFKIAFGKSCTDDRKIAITTKLTRGEEEIPSTIRSKWEDSHCVKQEMMGRGISEECVSARRLASILNKGVVTITYNEMPAIVRNATVRASNLFRYWMGPYMYDNQVEVRNAEDQIRIETVYYPIIGSMDLRVYKPRSNTFYHGIDIHPVAEVMLPFNPRLNAFRAIFGAPGLCLLDGETVTTYDGLSYNASISGCQKLVTKDCSGRYQMAVLANQEDGSKVVTVLLDQEKIELRPADLKVSVNGQLEALQDLRQVRNAEGQVVAIVRRTRDNFIELDSPSHLIRVTCNKEEVIVLGSPVHRGRLCGLCGSQTNNKMDDLTGPRQCSLPADLMDAAYELNYPQSCSSSKSAEEVELLRNVQRQCIKKEASTVFGLTDVRPLVPQFQQRVLSLAIRSADDPAGNCTIYRNKMIHRGNKRCFSTTSALKCAEGCKAESTTLQKLGFHCVPNGPLSAQLKEDMYVRPLDELIGKSISTVQEFTVPESCAPAQ